MLQEILRYFEKYEDETEERIAYGVEHFRKGNFALRVTDKAGKPLCGVKLRLIQKKHEFKHGANLFMLEEFDSEEKNRLYKECFAESFNMATLPFYWDSTEPSPGVLRYEKGSAPLYRRPPIDLCMEFCAEHGIEPREHALAYETFYPAWAKALPLPQMQQAWRARCQQIAQRYAHRIPTIEVTNELDNLLDLGWKPERLSALANKDDVIEWYFAQAARFFPDNQLVINERTPSAWLGTPNNRIPYYMQIERALKNGAPIHAIGMQYHMFRSVEEMKQKAPCYFNPRYLYRVMDQYAKFGLPLQITEVSFPAYTADREGEELQAKLLYHLYRIWFSHQSTEQIIYWNLPDGYAAYGPQGDFSDGENMFRAGLLRYDLSKKPAYDVQKHLFSTEWHSELTLQTDDEGKAYFKAFYGDYEATVDGKVYSLFASKHLPEDNEYNLRLTLQIDT